MRTVLKNHDEVAHFWANETQAHGTASRMFFENGRIYSYGRHFCIARHIAPGVIAFTTRDYSRSTSKHKYIVESAARHLRKVYCHNPDALPIENYRHAQEEIKAQLDASERPRIRQTTRLHLKGGALRIAERFNEYLAALPADKRGNVQPFDTSALEDVRAALVAAEQAREEKRKRDEEAARMRNAEAFEAWKQGAPRGNHYFGEFPIALRLSADGQTVETSRGADIPAKHARRLWPIVERVRASGSIATFGGDLGPKLGVYTLSTIRADGSIVVGCHDIPYSELERMARLFGLIGGASKDNASN